MILVTLFLIGLIFTFFKRSKSLYWHTIKKDKHYERFNLMRLRFFKFRKRATYEVMFNESAIYDIDSFGDDINKLCGFTDINSTVHQNSLRFGWRPNKKLQIDIFAYWYKNGVRGFEFLDSLDLHETYKLKLRITRSYYKFCVGQMNYYVSREKKGDFGVKVRLFPYFGGNKTAQQDIRIYLKEKI